MNNIFISIIIPTYNVPCELLERCLNSIKKQSFQEYEVILVDDGSEEFYRQQVIDFSNADSRIKIALNKHEGVSVARNIGIDNAKGTYIAFVDADDVISEQFLINAIKIAKDYGYPDMVIGGMEYVPFNEQNNTQFGKTIDVFQNEEIDVVKSSLMCIKDPRVKYHILGTPCGHLYKASISKNIKFPPDVPVCEDQVFNRRFLIKAKKVIVVPEMWYKYISNQGSVTHTKLKKLPYEMMIPYWDELLKIESEENYSNKDALRGYYIQSFYSAIRNCVNEDNATINQNIDKFLSHPLMRLALNKLNLMSEISVARKIEWMIARTKNKFLIRCLTKIIYNKSLSYEHK